MKRFTILVFILSALNIFAQLEWEYIDVPNDMPVRDIIMDDEGSLYSCFLGISKSTDGGSTWKSKNRFEFLGEQAEFIDVQTLFSSIFKTSNGTLLASLGYGDLFFRSTNDGELWLAVLDGPQGVNNFVEDNEGILYALTDYVTFSSQDMGLTWNEITELIDVESPDNSKIALGPDGSVFVPVSDGYFRKKPGGIFEKYNVGFEDVPVTCFYFNEGKIYLCADDNYGMYVSNDDGGNWEKIEAFDNKSINNMVITDDGRVIAMSDDGIIYSDDGKTQGFYEEFVDSDYYMLKKIGSRIYMSGFGLYFSDDNGRTWERNYSDYAPSIALFCHAFKSFPAITLTPKGMYKKAGNDWIEFNKQLRPDDQGSFHFDFFDNYYVTDDELLKSTNGGESFESLGYLSWTDYYDIAFANDGSIYMRTVDDRITFSEDFGESFNIFVDMNEIAPEDYIETVVTGLNGELLVGGFFNFYLTLDKGITWETISLPDELEYFYGIEGIINSKTILLSASNAGLFKSNDGGQTWNPAYSGITPPIEGFSDYPEINKMIYVNGTVYIASDWGFFYSEDFGQNWNKIQFDGKSAWGITILHSNDGRIYAMTSRGVYRTIRQFTDVEESEEKSTFSIYPNPADEQITVKISNALPGTIINLYDNTGRLLRTQEINTQTTEIPVSGLTPGMYYVGIKNGAETKFRKVAIVR